MTTIWQIVQKELKHNFRDRSGLIIMTLFPIILILVLGLSLSSMFESNGAPSKIRALYSADDSILGTTFRENFVDAAAENNLTLDETFDAEAAKKDISLNQYAAYVEIRDDQIYIYQNTSSEYAASLTSFMIKSFAASFDTISAIMRWDPSAMRFVDTDAQETAFVEEVPLSKAKSPKAMDYYAVTMLTMIIMYGSMAGLAAITAEKENRTIGRVLVTPVSNGQFLAGKLMGTMVSVILQAFIVFAFTAFILKTNWGSDLPAVLAIILSQIFMMTSAGIGVGYFFKSGTTGVALFQGLIPIMVFMGSGYVNLDLFGIKGPMLIVMELSPIRWINRSIIDIIYTGSYARFVPTIAMCLIIGLIFLVISIVFSGREVKPA